MIKPIRIRGITKELMPTGYGCMGQTHSYGYKTNEQDMVDMIRYARETGYTMFDTAPAYGPENEMFLGKAVKDFRDDVIIATKFGILHMPEEGGGMDLNSTHDSILQQVDESLKRLGTDYIDLYYQHRVDPNVEPEEVAETMKELHQAGKILSWGVSFASIDYIQRAHKVFPLSAVENMYNMLDRNDENTYFPLCAELGLVYVSACPLAKGFLSGKINPDTSYREGDWRNRMPLFSEAAIRQNQVLLDMINTLSEKKKATAAQITLSWEMHRVPYMIPIPGTTKKHRIKENYESVYVDLSEDEVQSINDQLGRMNTIGMRG